jgi:hypothetical protein
MADQSISEKVILSAQVPASQRDELARLATEHDRSLSYVVRAALCDYLEHEGSGGVPRPSPGNNPDEARGLPPLPAAPHGEQDR